MSEPINITISNTNSVDVSVTLATDSKSVAITDGSNVSLSIDSEAGNTIVATQQSPTLSLSVAASEALDVQTKQKMSVSVINPNKYVYTEGSTWGDIAGTITNQTDLVNYITSRLPNIPYQTVSDIVNALNQLDAFRLQSSVDFRPENFGIGDEANEYTFPSPLTSSEKYGYFLLSDNNGVLQWKLFPLDFITGFDEGAKVDGGDF